MGHILCSTLLLGKTWLLRAEAQQIFARGLHAPLAVTEPRQRGQSPLSWPSQGTPRAFFLSAVFLLHDFQLANVEPVLKRPGLGSAA